MEESLLPETMETVKLKEEQPIYDWKDITKEFFGCCRELSLGELMIQDHFGLFEAMSAIEMMDPKMDGYCNKNLVPLTFETAVASGQLKIDGLEPAELIGLFDSLFSCLVSWLEGHSLAQTIYTCLYMHGVETIVDKRLKAFCLGFVNLIDVIKDMIFSAGVSDEEDFQFFPFDQEFAAHNVVYNTIKEAEDELIKSTKQSDDNAEEQAVINRLKFLRFFLDTLKAFNEAKKEGDIKIIKQLNIMSELLPSIKRTIEKGTQPEGNDDPMGFSPMVNQRLLAPTFPRLTKIKDRHSAISILEELIQRLKLVCKVTGCTTYHSALNFFMDFSRKCGNCLLSRCVLQKYYLSPSLVSFKDFLRESVKSFIAPPALMPGNPLYQNEAAQKCVEQFFDISSNMHAMYTFLQTCGFNRARQRDRLVRLLDDFVNLQDEAERVDAYLHSLVVKTKPTDIPRQYLACFGTWVLYNSLRAMCSFLLSGLELELYSVHEYLYIFWYLYEFLFGWVVSALTRADSFLAQEALNSESLAGVKAAKNGKKKDKSKKKNRGNVKPYANEIMQNQALQNMCGGYYKGLAGFIKDDRIPQPLSMFDNEVIRFNYRFAPFASFTTPPAVPYCEFRDMRTNLLKLPSTELYSAAAKHFHQARSLLEQIPNPDADINDTLRVAKVNFIVMNLLANGHKKDSTKPPEFDFSTHRYFPTIKQQ